MIHYSVGLRFSQEKYSMNLLHEIAIDNCKIISIPMISTIVFDPSPKNHLVDGSLYIRIICKLHYLSFTRTDIAFAISKLLQAMHQPFMSHWDGLK